MKPFAAHTEQIWDNTMAVNVKGHFLCAKAVVLYMMKKKSSRIINVGSIFGHNGISGCLVYGVSKMAIHGFIRMLAKELAPYNIRVNAVAPGNIVTPLNILLYKMMSPKEDVARRANGFLLKLATPSDALEKATTLRGAWCIWPRMSQTSSLNRYSS